MPNTALGRSEVSILANKSGGSLAQGDVVIVDTANASAVTTTTTSGYLNGRIGVVLEPNGIANNANGLIAFGGYVPVINLSGTGSIGDLVKTHTVAKQAVRHAAPVVAGDFAQVLGTSATPAALLFGAANQATFNSAAVDVTGTFGLSGDISPSQITSNQNDYSPTGLSTATVLRLNSDASRNITGLTGGADGRIITIYNTGSNDIVLKKDDGATSTAGNRFALQADITLAGGDGCLLIYDSTSSRWRCIGKTPGGGGGGITIGQADPYGIHHRLSGSNAHDDEFSSDTSADYTEVDPTGTTTWVIANGVLSCVFSGQASGDYGAKLKPMTLADGEWFEVHARALGQQNTNYTVLGILITDGVLNTSNAISAQILDNGTVLAESYKGTITNMATVIASISRFGREAFAGIRIRLKRVSSTSFQASFGTPDGAQFDTFGLAAGDPGFTPTHAGVFVSVYGGANKGMASFDFIRHMS